MTESVADWQSRSIGIIGAGVMGLSLAALLGQTVPVVLVCRDPERAAMLFRQGAIVRGGLEASSHPIVVRHIGDLARVGGVSAVFVATKTTAIDAVADELGPLMNGLGDQPQAPFVVSFQNGIEPGRQMIERLGDPRVLRMVLNYGARLAADGAVEVTLSRPPHHIGCLDPAYWDVCRALADTLSASGLETSASRDIEPDVWMKGIVNASAGAVAALTDASVGETLDSPAGRIVGRLLEEGVAVARAEGIDLGERPLDLMWAMLDTARPHTPSMVEDIRAGRPSEVGQLNRQIIEHARRTDTPVPTHELITSLIDAFDWRVFQRGEAGRNG